MKSFPFWQTLILSAACWGSVTALAGPRRGPDALNFPNVQLSQTMGGQAAINALQAQLPAVAQAYGLDAQTLTTALHGDATLAADRQGRLLFQEPPVEASAVQAAGIVQPQALAPLANTFKLHSRPTAKRIIYLDFNGHVIHGTRWNTDYNGGRDIIAPPWSLDADPAFSDTERTTIQYIWQRVAEDYSPFDVDVTTELTSEDQITRSSQSDEYYGNRALISPISSYFGNYGGVSYVGAFDEIGDTHKPSLIFPENLANGESYIAEAISHEIGHSFNLLHDGSPASAYYRGQGNWAPIMGVGYYESLVQFSRGEYSGANNSQDDLAIIASYVGYRADDHGDTAATATVLPTVSSWTVSGVISSSADVDVFSFDTGSGPVVISLNPDNRSANLDILAELRDANGALVATSNPLGALNASFNLSLSAGTYFLHVRGTGEGDPLTTGYSAYGSIGQYTISGSVVPSGPQPPVAVATVTPNPVLLGQPVAFDASGSYDPDGGAIGSYLWDFGDGTTSPDSVISKIYAARGNYSVVLTVTDNEFVSTSKTIPLLVNAPPTAVITANTTTGFAPLTVAFNGSGSTDAEGPIAAYAWNFGDGTTSTAPAPSKTYSTLGTYTATLTVTDSNGAKASASAIISVTQNPATVIRVDSITMTSQTSSTGKTVKAIVKVTNLSTSAAVSGVTVSGSWSGLVSGSATAKTDNSGNATFTSAKFKTSGTESFGVTGLSRPGYTYSPSNNRVTTKSLVVP